MKTFQTVCITSFEDMTLSGGHLFEHKAALAIYRAHADLFLRGQIRPVGATTQLDEFAVLKAEQYAHLSGDKSRDYGIYVGDGWKRHFNRPVQIMVSSKDTSGLLAQRLRMDPIIPEIMRSRIEDIINSRQNRAITIPLFSKSNLFSDTDLSVISDSISRNYATVYRDLYGGWIFVGSGLIAENIETLRGAEFEFRVFDYICRELNLTRVFDQKMRLAELRGSIEHVRFVRALRKRFNIAKPDQSWMVGQILGAVLNKRDFGRSVRRDPDSQFASVAQVLDSFDDMNFEVLYEEVSRNRTGSQSDKMSDRKTRSSRVSPRAYIVVAVRRELEAVRRAIADAGYAHSEARLARRDGEIFWLPLGSGDTLPVGLLIATAGGKSSMSDLISAIERFERPELVLMAGMMAGIKKKAVLLEVIAPSAIYDVTALGTKEGAITSEPESFRTTPIMRQKLAAVDWSHPPTTALKVTTHKKTATVAAKIDDISHELAQAALQVDHENIVGLEMEGAALNEMQELQSFHAGSVQYLMVKGVADYAGELISDAEAAELASSLANNTVLTADADPTNNLTLKALLQTEATRRSFLVCERVIRSWFALS